MKVSDLHAAIYSEETRAEAFEIIRTLINKVLIHQGSDCKPTIELLTTSHLWSTLLCVTHKTQKAPLLRGFLYLVLFLEVLVAGTRNQYLIKIRVF